MNTRASQFRLQIAEKSAGSLSVFAMLRWALVVVFLWFGAMKFTAYEANGIAPFIINSPIMSWLHSLFGFREASYVIGVLELSTAAALILGAFQPIFSALGAAMSAATYLITLTFFLSTPGWQKRRRVGFRRFQLCPASSFSRMSFCWLHRFVCFWRLSKPRSPTHRDLELNRRPDIRAAHREGDGIYPKVRQTAKRLQIT